MPTALGIAWLTAAIVDFTEWHRISNLTINEAITAAEVDWENNDLAVVHDNPPATGKYWRSLNEVRLCAVCSATLFPRLDLRNRDRKLSSVALRLSVPALDNSYCICLETKRETAEASALINRLIEKATSPQRRQSEPRKTAGKLSS